MLDTEVLAAVKRAKVARKSAVTRANCWYNAVASEAFVRFGSSDVEQAARANALRRADVALPQNGFGRLNSEEAAPILRRLV